MSTLLIDPRDAALQAHTPAVMVPRYGELPALENSGHRFLIADDGVYIDVHRPWLRLRYRVAAVPPLPLSKPAAQPFLLPYGPVDPFCEFAFDDGELDAVIVRFAEDARGALPDEAAAWGVWNERTGRLHYCACLALAASPGGLQYSRPRLQPHEHLAVDLHSHGILQPFFSTTDDADDRDEIKISVVLGRLDQPSLHWTARLCALGTFIQLGLAL